MNLHDLIVPNLVSVSALLTLTCFLFKDQIKLRIFAVASDIVLCLYYYLAFPHPLWDGMTWSMANVVVNTTMIIAILNDARMSPMSDNELNLFRTFSALNPGQFRRLMKKAVWHTATEEIELTHEGKPLDHLYYVLDGTVTVKKGGRVIAPDAKLFIGEIAYLHDTPASATVSIAPGSVYVAWRAEDLRKQMQANDDLRTVFSSLVNSDLAGKVAKS